MSQYTPDKWVVVKIDSGEESTQKVLASYYGGYAGSNTWKLSSEIRTIIDYEDYYEFRCESGSIYICYRDAYGMSGYTASIYNSWEKMADAEFKIEIVEKFRNN
jgi:hypothetical protein